MREIEAKSILVRAGFPRRHPHPRRKSREVSSSEAGTPPLDWDRRRVSLDFTHLASRSCRDRAQDAVDAEPGACQRRSWVSFTSPSPARVHGAMRLSVAHWVDAEFEHFRQLGEMLRERICVPAFATLNHHSI